MRPKKKEEIIIKSIINKKPAYDGRFLFFKILFSLRRAKVSRKEGIICMNYA
jgi:hypothetical protein